MYDIPCGIERRSRNWGAASAAPRSPSSLVRSLSSTPTPQQLKKALIASGFEVFRTLPDEVVLAERVRENLILDSGVRVAPLEGGTFQVRLVLRAQQGDFPNEAEDTLFERVRVLAEPAIAQGFAERTTAVTAVKDPADATRTLDTFYEVHLAHDVATVEDAVPVLKFVLSLEKAAAQR